MIAVVAGLFGLVIGSFLNVVIHRGPLRKAIVWPSSRCPSCGEYIKRFDNLPVLSYLMLRGRCRSCKARISPRYPLVESLTGMLFALAAYEFGLSLSPLMTNSLVWALVLLSVLVALAGRTSSTGCCQVRSGSPQRLWDSCCRRWSTRKGGGFTALGRGGCGGALRASHGLSGWYGTGVREDGRHARGVPRAVGRSRGLSWGSLGALVDGIFIVTGVVKRGSALPFAVFLALAGVVTLFLGQDVWGWYLQLVREA